MDEREFIAQMNRNQRIMNRIDKLFFITGFLCVILNGFISLFEVILIPKYLIDNNPFDLLEALLAPLSAVFSVLSSCKNEKWTVAALGVFIIRVFLMMIVMQDTGLAALMFFAFAMPQYLCMRQYEKLSILKGMFGYPGFNAEIYMQKPKYSRSGTNYSSRTRRTKAKKASRSASMDDIDPPPTSGEYEDIFTNRRKPL